VLYVPIFGHGIKMPHFCTSGRTKRCADEAGVVTTLRAIECLSSTDSLLMLGVVSCVCSGMMLAMVCTCMCVKLHSVLIATLDGPSLVTRPSHPSVCHLQY